MIWKLLFIGTTSLPFTASAVAQDTPLFYRGAFDDKVVEAPNGALVNKDYLAWSQESTQETVVHKPREGVWSISNYSISNYTLSKGNPV